MKDEAKIEKQDYPAKRMTTTVTIPIPEDKSEIWKKLKELLEDPDIILNSFCVYSDSYTYTTTAKETFVSETLNWFLRQK